MARSVRWAAAALAVLTLFRLLCAGVLPLSPDETYYWVWSRALAPGYVDHPPMVALWIRVGTFLLGDCSLGVRILGPLAAALTTLLLANAADRMFPNQRAGLIAGALWNATLFVGAGSVVMTPDAPLLFFWCATVWALARIVTGGGVGWWLAIGCFAGLAMASKYTAAFLWLGIGLWILTAPSARHWLHHPAPWAGALLGLAVVFPVVLWNAEHEWVSVLKQGGRVADWQPERALVFLAELIGGQIGLVTPGVLVLCVAGLVAAVRAARAGRDGGAGALQLALTLPPVVVFIQHAFGDRVQGNWPEIVYPAAIIAAAGLVAPRWHRWVWPSVGAGIALSAIVALHAVTGVLPLPVVSDPAARNLAGWSQLAAKLETLGGHEQATFVVAEQYALLSELAWNASGAVPVIGIEPRLNPMALPRMDMRGRVGILVRNEYRGDEIDPATWSSAISLGMIERTTPRGIVERYHVWRVAGRIQGVVLPARRFAASE